MYVHNFYKSAKIKFSMSKSFNVFISLFLFSFLMFMPLQSLAATAEMCQNKVLETVTVTGKYLGWGEDIPPFPGVYIELAGERYEPLNISASKNEAEKFFGAKKNVFAKVTYELIQEFSRKESRCNRFNILKSVTILQGSRHDVTPMDNICKAKRFFSKSIKGIYKGYTPEGDGTVDYVTIDVDNQETTLLCNYEKVEKFFSKNSINKQFTITYALERVHGEAGCDVAEVCLSAQPFSEVGN